MTAESRFARAARQLAGPGLPFTLAALVLAHMLASFAVSTPFIFADEVEYWLMAHQLGAGRLALTWAGRPFDYPSIAYPLLLAPLSHLPPATLYVATKLLNCLLMASVALPVQRLARRIGADATAAGWAAILAVALPDSVYTAHVMVEPLYFPLFTWAVYAVVRLLDDHNPPPAWACALWGLLLGGLFLVKPQGLLAPLLFAAGVVWRLVPLAGRARPDRAWWGRVAVVAGGILAGLGLRLAVLMLSGQRAWPPDVRRFLGFYAFIRQLLVPGADLWLIAPVLALYVVVLAVALGVVPLLAVLSPARLWSRRATAAGLLWSVCLVAMAALVVVFARNTLLRNVFPSGHIDALVGLRLQERYLFPVAGAVLALWAACGMRGPAGDWRAALAAGAATALGLALLLPHLSLAVFQDAPSLNALEGLALGHSMRDRAALWLAVALLACLVAAAWRAGGDGRPALVLALFLVLSAGAYAGAWGVSHEGRNTRHDLPAARLVAAAVPPHALLLFDRALPPDLYLAVEFWHPAGWRLVSAAAPLRGLDARQRATAYLVLAANASTAAASLARDAVIVVVPARSLVGPSAASGTR